MPVPHDIDHRLRMMIWAWAVAGLGAEDIKVRLKQAGFEVPLHVIWEALRRAHETRKT